MIKILLSRITSEGVNIEGSESKKNFDLEENKDLQPFKDVTYSLTASLVSGGVLVTGVATTCFKAKCGRCLKIFPLHITNSDVCHFYENTNKNEIDLTEDIREDILIVLPQKIICSNSCKGICSKCGKNLNLESCSCPENKEKISEWDKLDALGL